MSTFTSEPGIRLGGRYRLEDRLAAASGWSAWKAIDEILARPVSVITFAAGFPRLEQVVMAARAASRLTDTRLTQVFDVEDSWERAYIVLEWPAGETLSDLLLDPGTLEPAAGARIIAEVASALSGAHAAGLAHLCLRPDAVRWTAGGGVKVTGLGIDAALAGVTAEDPQLADTHGLGELLYAALTGLWPGADYPGLPTAPESDGEPRRPRQVRAGVPTSLDEVAARALGLPGRDASFTTPAELATALSAAIPPEEIPLAAALQRGSWREPGRFSQGRTAEPPWSDPRQDDPGATRPPGGGARYLQEDRNRRVVRVAAVGVLVLAAVAGLSAAAFHLLHKSSPPTAASTRRPGHTSSPSAQSTGLPVASASGFDALNPSDGGDENSAQAENVLNGGHGGWVTQQYYGSPYFGGLKKGTGLLLNMGKPVRVTSVTVTFGDVPGANVEILEGSSDARSQANLAAMTPVASAKDVSGKYTFTVARPVNDQYLVIWFTKLPPMAGGHGHKGQAAYMAQVYNVAVTGTGGA
jgi:serine/threonine protein kinase